MEEIIFKVGVETGDAKSKIDAVGKSTEKVNEQAKKTSGSFTNLKTELRQLTVQLQNLDPASKEFETVAKRAGQIKEQMRGVADAINDADPEKFGGKFQRTAEGIAGAFSAVTGAQAIFGANSEEIEKQILKVQGAIALTQGISAMKELKNDSLDLAMALKKNVVGAVTSLTTAELINAEATGSMTLLQKAYTVAVGTSTGAMKIFRLALITSGIGALVVLLGMAVEAMDLFGSETEETAKKQKELKDRQKAYQDQIQNEIDLLRKLRTERKGGENSLRNEIEILKAKGATDKEIYEAEKKLIQEQINSLEFARGYKGKLNFEERKQLAELKTAKIVLDAEYYKTVKENRKKAHEEAVQKNKENAEKLKAQQEKEDADRLALKRKYEDLMTANITDVNTRELSELALKHQREIEDLKKQYGDKIKLKTEFDQMMSELDKNQKIETDKLKEDQKKREDEENQKKIDKANLDAKSKLEADIINLENNFTAQQQKRIELENLDFEQQLQNKELTNGEIEKIKAQHEANLNAIAEDSKNHQIEIDNALAEAKFNLVTNIGSAIGAIGNLFDQGSKQAKAFALVQLGIDTAVGFMNGLRIAQQSASATGPGAVYAFPIFYAQQIASVLGAVGRAKSILGSGTSVQAPAVNRPADIGTNNNKNSTAKTETQVSAQTTYKVVVVDSDITKMQEKTKKVELISSI